MRFIFSIIKNIVAIIAIVIIVFFALKYAPFLKDQQWNPVSNDEPSVNHTQTKKDLAGGQRYTVNKFGSDSIRVYRTEIEMEQDLNQLGEHIELLPPSSYE